jgi:hypothetical protein
LSRLLGRAVLHDRERRGHVHNSVVDQVATAAWILFCARPRATGSLGQPVELPGSRSARRSMLWDGHNRGE